MSVVRRLLAAIGTATRRQFSLSLQVVALFWGVISEGGRPSTWQRIVRGAWCVVRGAFRSSLTKIVVGSLATTVVMAVIIGVAVLFETLNLLWTGTWRWLPS